MAHILGISGSLRTESYNTAILRAATALLPAGVSMSLFDLTPIPMYNRDVEVNGLPPIVGDLKAQIKQADALLLATPEYNHSVSGALKNAIDWASRRDADETFSPLYGKPAGLITVVTGMFGGVRGYNHLRDIAFGVNMQVIQRPMVTVPQAKTKFDEEGRLTDEQTRQFLRELVTNLVASLPV